MAEGEGFEPSRPLLRAYSLSRGAPSAARPSLRGRESRRIAGEIESASVPAKGRQTADLRRFAQVFWQKSDKLGAALRGTVIGARTVKIEPTGSDTYQVELAVSQTHVDRLIKAYRSGLL